jgi:uncharacterized membrane protein
MAAMAASTVIMHSFKWYAFLSFFFASSCISVTHREWKSEGRESILILFLLIDME